MATLISKQGVAATERRADALTRGGYDLPINGAHVHIMPSSTRMVRVAKLFYTPTERTARETGPLVVLHDPHDLIPHPDGAIIPDMSRYIDSTYRDMSLREIENAIHFREEYPHPIVRFIYQQGRIHTSNLALILPREILRVMLLGNDYYIANVPVPTRIIAEYLAPRRRLRITDYVTRVWRSRHPTRMQVERAARDLFSESEPGELDYTLCTTAAARAPPAEEPGTATPGAIVAKEFVEYDG